MTYDASRTEGKTLGSTRRTTTTRGHSRAQSARRSWRRVRRIFRSGWLRAARTVTPVGRFVLAAAVTAAVLGASFDWVEAWAVAIAAVVLLVVAVPFLLGTRAYRVQIATSRSRVTAGGEVELRIEVENASASPALPAIAELPVGAALREISIPFLGPHAATTVTVEVPTPTRGVVEVGPVTLARQDPLGLLRRVLTWRERRIVHVHPATVAIPPGLAGRVRDLEGDASRRLTDADLSFHAVRDYADGDSRRHIHWRSTAKTGALMVRQYEESQTARAAILFDADRSEYGSDAEFELAVSVAASLSLQAVREGRERLVASQWAAGRTRSQIVGLEELPSRSATQLLDAWSSLQPAVEPESLESLARALAGSRRQLSMVAMVTGSQQDAVRLRRAAVVFPPDVAVLAIRCELFADPQAGRMDVCTLITAGALGDIPHLLLRRGAS